MTFERDYGTLLLPDSIIQLLPSEGGTVKKATARDEPVPSLSFIFCTCSDINLCSLHTQNASGISFQ